MSSKKHRHKRGAPAPISAFVDTAATPAPRIALTGTGFAAIALALYWSSLKHPLVFDDLMLRDDFLGYYGASLFRFDLRWFAYSTFGWTYDLAGKDWFWHRLVSVLLHAGNAGLLYALTLRVYQSVAAGEVAGGMPGIPGGGAAAALQGSGHSAGAALTPAGLRWSAVAGALIFLLHPAAVYGVAYLAQRSILMATMASLACLLFMLEGLMRRRARWHCAAAVAYFVAVFSKEHAVALPLVAAAMAYLVRGASRHGARALVREPVRESVRELTPLFALFAITAVLITFKVKGLLGAPYEPLAQEILAQIPEARGGTREPALVLSILNQAWLYLRYLGVWLLPWPGWMSIDLRPTLPAHWLAWPQSAGALLYLAYGGVALWLLLWRRSVAGLALLFPWLLGLTEMSAVRVQEPFVLYRSYLWMSGLVLALPLVAARLPVKAACAGFALIVPLLCAASLDRLGSFASAYAVWDDAVRKVDASAPLAERAFHNRGFALLGMRKYPEALADFNRAIEINPLDADAWLGRGVLQTRTGNHAAGIAGITRAIELDPNYAEAYAKRCFVKMLQDRPQDAVIDCEKAVSLDKRHRDARTNLGVVYAALGRGADAEASYRRALEMDAGNADAHYNYGVLLLVQQRRALALPHLKIACDARVRAACDMLPVRR